MLPPRFQGRTYRHLWNNRILRKEMAEDADLRTREGRQSGEEKNRNRLECNYGISARKMITPAAVVRVYLITLITLSAVVRISVATTFVGT